MHLDSFLAQAFVYLLAAVISVPIAKRLGLGSVLGYLLAGAVIGPFVLGAVGDGSGNVLEFSEFGVVMMMFIIGLELRPALLWRLRGPIIGMGGAQVLGTASVIGLAGLAVGFVWKEALAVGIILAMSSTAIVLQSLAEKGQLKTEAGKSAFAVLLSQDIAVVPILAILPLLAAKGAAAAVSPHGSHMAGWQQGLLTIGAVAAIVGGGRYLVRPIFRFIAGAKLREVFTATALVLVVGIALLMESVGLSPALGTFLAGVVLADSEFRHELESDIEPFKGLLLGIFFIAVGAGLDFSMVGAFPLQIMGAVIALILLKMLVLLVIAKVARLPSQDASLFVFALAQGGEFCFVLLTFSKEAHILPDSLIKPLNAIVAISMGLTPLLLLFHSKVVLPRLKTHVPPKEMDAIQSDDSPVIIAGFGRFGLVVGRLLRMNGIQATVLDLDSEQVEFLRQLGLKLFYGDASRLDLLETAGAHRAKILVVAIDDKEKSLEMIDHVKKHFPHLTILARAEDRLHAYELLHRGVKHIYRETFGSSVEMADQTLRLLGIPEHVAARASQIMREMDEKSLHIMAEVWKKDGWGKDYVKEARQQIEEMDRLFKSDQASFASAVKGGDLQSVMEEALEQVKNSEN